MRDVIVVAIIFAFFALCVAYVRWCDRIIGPDPDDLHEDDVEQPAVHAIVDGQVVDVAAAAGATAVDRGAAAVRS